MMAALVREVGLGQELREIESVDPRVWATSVPIKSMGVLRSVWRRGKILILEDDNQALLLHFGMTGQLLRKADGRKLRLRFVFGNKGMLYLVDRRCLGWAEPCVLSHLEGRLKRSGLGDEFWPGQRTASWWSSRLGVGRGGLKAAMLRQTGVAGLGNIAVSEILWRAQISPDAQRTGLTQKHWSRLARAAEQHVEACLAREDADSLQYVNHGGDNLFSVYGREGEACPRCDALISRVVQAGRPTFFCPTCQERSL